MLRVSHSTAMRCRHSSFVDSYQCKPASLLLLHSQRGSRTRCHCATKPREVAATAARAEVFATPATSEDEQDELSCVSTGLGDVSCVLEHRESPSPSPVTEQPELSGPLQALLTVSPFAFWGTSMVVMKGLMATIPPMVMGAFRLLPAGLVLVAWAAAQGRPHPNTWRAWAWVVAFALVDGAAFQGFLAEGLTKTPAGLGSVIIDSQPLTVAVLAALLFGEHLGTAGVLGLFLGVAGLLLLELPEQYLLLATDGLLTAPSWESLSHSASSLLPAAATTAATATTALTATAATATTALTTTITSGALDLPPGTLVTEALTTTQEAVQVGTSWAERVWSSLNAQALLTLGSPSAWLASGEFWMLAAAQAMALGTVMVRYVTRECDPVMATGYHMVIGGVILSMVALSEDPAAVSHAVQGLGPQDLAAAAYVSLLGGAASYGIFFYLASHSQGSLTRLSSLTFLTPVFAAVTGYFVLGEVLTAPQLLGGAITLGSVLLITSSKNSAAAASGDKDQSN